MRETNFNTYRVLRANEMPEIDVLLVASDALPGGIGELAVGPVAPAICNAIFAATGKRLRALPIAAHQLVRALRAACWPSDDVTAGNDRR